MRRLYTLRLERSTSHSECRVTDGTPRDNDHYSYELSPLQPINKVTLNAVPWGLKTRLNQRCRMDRLVNVVLQIVA